MPLSDTVQGGLWLPYLTLSSSVLCVTPSLVTRQPCWFHLSWPHWTMSRDCTWQPFFSGWEHPVFGGALSHVSSISQAETGPGSVLNLQAHCTVITIQSAQIRSMPSGNFGQQLWLCVCLQPPSLYLLLNMISEQPFWRVTAVTSDFLWQLQASRINPKITWQVCWMSGPIQPASTHGAVTKSCQESREGE